MPIRDHIANLLTKLIGLYTIFETTPLEMDVDPESEQEEPLPPLPAMTLGNANIEHLFRRYEIDNRHVVRHIIKENLELLDRHSA